MHLHKVYVTKSYANRNYNIFVKVWIHTDIILPEGIYTRYDQEKTGLSAQRLNQ